MIILGYNKSEAECEISVIVGHESIEDFKNWVRNAGGNPEEEYDSIHAIDTDSSLHSKVVEALIKVMDNEGNSDAFRGLFTQAVKIGMEIQKQQSKRESVEAMLFRADFRKVSCMSCDKPSTEQKQTLTEGLVSLGLNPESVMREVNKGRTGDPDTPLLKEVLVCIGPERFVELVLRMLP
ncbi:MAG: hypothetical protein WCW31_04085 [Patescibacteria group bacterium]